MRRRRKPLEVSTFPFLAVLLCAMGSLILVLLVMDKKAKSVARAKARDAVAKEAARTADDAEQAAAARRAELEKRTQEARAEWEKKRNALHTRLLTEQQALQLQMQQLREQMTLAAARLRFEQVRAGELKTQIEAGRGQIQEEATALAQQRQALTDTEKRTEQERAALARMTHDLALLEQALKDLKEAREREKQTYSVVPYHGKRGESRRPMYIECAAAGVIFHPDRKALYVQAQKSAVRAEVEQRIARQREQLASATVATEAKPYLMLLVRPNGIDAYYAFQAALAGLDVQFGYELIDADWELDFPRDDEQPWQTVVKQPEGSPSEPPKPGEPRVQGVQMVKPVPAATSSQGIGSPQTADSRPPGEGSDRPGSPSDNPLSSGNPGPPSSMKPGSVEDRGPSHANAPPASGTPKLPWETVGTGSPQSIPTRPPDVRSAPVESSHAVPPASSNVKGERPTGSSARMNPGAPATPSPGSPPPDAGAATTKPTGEPVREKPERGPRNALGQLPTPGGEPKRPQGLRAARLNGDREYLIFIECKPEGVVLYPSRQEYPLTTLTGGVNNALVQAVLKMIERRQSGVQSGETPYRPQVRFLVRPESLRSYHLAYPLFESLPLAKTRQNLIPEDDVLSIIAGY